MKVVLGNAFNTDSNFVANPGFHVPSFGVWSTSESPAFEAELRKTFEEVRVEPIEFFNETCDQHETNWLFLAKTPTSR